MRNAGFALAIIAVGLIGVGHALVELTLATRPRLEAWQVKRASGTGLFPRERWHR